MLVTRVRRPTPHETRMKGHQTGRLAACEGARR
jgi:hypothetical protein